MDDPHPLIEPASMDDLDALTDAWVALASEQRAHDSHVLPEDNRTPIRETLAQYVVTESLLVARPGGAPDDDRTRNARGESDEAPLGFVAFGVDTGGFDGDCRRGLIYYLYVRPDARDCGVGSALLARAETELAEQGVDIVALEAMADNEAAKRFYRRHGYGPHRVEFEKPLEPGGE